MFATTFALGLGFSLRLLNPADESWFVQVIARMRAGDVLYRDIAFGAGPLPAYATAGLTYLTGVDVLAVKLVVVRRDPALTEAGIRAWCEANLTGYKRPRVIEFRQELPKSPVGKILRRELR